MEAVIPSPKGVPAGGYLKLERRVGDFATAGVAVALEMSGDMVMRAGIALTGVGGSTIEATAAEQALVGKPLTTQTIEQAAGLTVLIRGGGPPQDRSSRQCGIQAAHSAHLRRAHPEPRR